MCRRATERGSILILALWSISVLAILAVSLGVGTRQKLTLIQRLYSGGMLRTISADGVETAKAILRPRDLTETFDTLQEDWANDPAHFKDVQVSGGSFTVSHAVAESPEGVAYGLIDEERKLNVNAFDASAIFRLLKVLQISEDEDEIQQLAYSIVDWRDSDSAYGHPQFGAEDGDYDDLPLPYKAKDSAFESLEELLLVKGMSAEIFDKIRPFVTIYGTAGVNLNTAPRVVLTAAGLPETLADKVLAYRAGSDTIPFTRDDLNFPQPDTIAADLKRLIPIDGAEQVALENLASTEVLKTASNYFEVVSRGKLDSGRGEIETRAVIDRRGKVYSYRVSKIQWPQTN